jgi:hypothetical protein
MIITLAHMGFHGGGGAGAFLCLLLFFAMLAFVAAICSGHSDKSK